MNAIFVAVGLAIPVFIATNIDDIFLLLAFFANDSFKGRQVVIGQFLSMGALIVVSLLCAVIALVIPSAYIGLLGLLPVGIGVKELLALRNEEDDEEGTEPERFAHSKILSVAAVTFASGGDNVSIYVPLFSTRSPVQIAAIVVTFLLLTGFWCWGAHWLVHHQSIGNPIRKYGRLLLPWVLMGLGLYILLEADTFALLSRLS